MNQHSLDKLISDQKNVLFVDGECSVCNRFALWTLRNDSTQSVLIASLQSDLGREACRRARQDPDDLRTVIFLQSGRFFVSSTAVLRSLLNWGGVVKLMAQLFLFVPHVLRDWCYAQFAARRKKLPFFKKGACEIPDKNLQHRILS